MERVAAKLGDRDWPLTLVEVAGQRGNYRFSDQIGTLGHLETKVRDLLVVCSDENIDMFTLPADSSGPLAKMVAVAPISVPPRVSELAAFAPLHIDEVALRRDGGDDKLRLVPARRYLIRAKIVAADGRSLGHGPMVARGPSRGPRRWPCRRRQAPADRRRGSRVRRSADRQAAPRGSRRRRDRRLVSTAATETCEISCDRARPRGSLIRQPRRESP